MIPSTSAGAVSKPDEARKPQFMLSESTKDFIKGVSILLIGLAFMSSCHHCGMNADLDDYNKKQQELHEEALDYYILCRNASHSTEECILRVYEKDHIALKDVQ